ncbi:MAG: hypothetical protein IT291_01030 [Deltaproteobacteria bacterium]|nr:hypothetical protein [Deltaproteobacteria bacterium]
MNKLYKPQAARIDNLNVLQTSSHCSFYELPKEEDISISRFLASTPESREICNDPFLVGVNYTAALTKTCTAVLKAFQKKAPFELNEKHATVLNILRGGLNFGLREALFNAFNWNEHASAFISAQRARKSVGSEDWYISENEYQKVYFSPQSCLIFADVVATGTSLAYALQRVLSLARYEEKEIESILFLTIGGIKAEQLLLSADKYCREHFRTYSGAAVIYLEGRFDVATSHSDLRIKISGTDLLRKNALLTPEFFNSQYDDPAFPLERCAIYDAGSRAFLVEEHYRDVLDYWRQTLALANNGSTYEELLTERCPDLTPDRFKSPNLSDLCWRQVHRLQERLKGCSES